MSSLTLRSRSSVLDASCTRSAPWIFVQTLPSCLSPSGYRSPFVSDALGTGQLPLRGMPYSFLLAKRLVSFPLLRPSGVVYSCVTGPNLVFEATTTARVGLGGADVVGPFEIPRGQPAVRPRLCRPS